MSNNKQYKIYYFISVASTCLSITSQVNEVNYEIHMNGPTRLL